jgi:Holliday junction resolvase RusA-like endonuclease
MTFQVMFSVYGEPVPKGRPRFSTRGKFVQTYTPQKTRTYEAEVAMMAKAAMGASKPLKGGLDVYIHLSFPIPASYSKKRAQDCLNEAIKHTKKPDADNCAKSIIDGMAGIVFDNDSQIVSLHIHKTYGEIAKAEILVREA